MLYVLSKIIWAIGRPSMTLLFLVLAGLMLQLFARDSRSGFILVLAGAAGLAACTLLPVGTWLLRPLEDRFPPANNVAEPVDGIILLGGSIDVETSVDRGTPAFNIRGERIVAFVSLARKYPHARLLFTGGNPRLFSSGVTEADEMRVLASDLGLAPERILFERQSRNTRENALFSKRMADPKPDSHWLLITSAADMPRAVGCFRAINWPIIPVAVDYHTRQHSAGWMPGLVAGLQQVDWATHEWVGLLYYRLRGWIPSIFPGPQP